MTSKSIPQEVKRQVDEAVTRFNQSVIRGTNRCYITRYRGSYLYLDRFDYGRSCPICRLKYTGDINGWKFAIFKYSDERYDPLEAYP